MWQQNLVIAAAVVFLLESFFWVQPLPDAEWLHLTYPMTPPLPPRSHPQSPQPRSPQNRPPRRWKSPFCRRLWRRGRLGLPGLLSALLIIGLLHLGTWRPLELTAYKTLFQLRGAIPWDDRVALVVLDQRSLSVFADLPGFRSPAPPSTSLVPDRSPLTPSVLTPSLLSEQPFVRLLEQLNQAKASTVVFDLLLPNLNPDSQLSQTIQQQGRVILAIDPTATLTPPPPPLAGIGSGHTLIQRDEDGIVRTVELNYQGTPALGLAAVQAYDLVQEPIQLAHVDRLDRRVWLNWLSPAAQVPTYAWVDVMAGKIAPERLHDRIILVGATTPTTATLRTPFDPTQPIPELFLHATLINNLLQGNFLRLPPPPMIWLGLGMSGMVLSGLMSRWRIRHRLIALLMLCLGWSVVCVVCLRLNYWLPVASPIALWITTTAAVLLSDRLHENHLLQQEVKRLWQNHYQDLILRLSPPPHAPTPSLPPPRQQITQIALLADQFARSQSAQAAIARSLSIGILAADWDGLVWFCNPVATHHLQVRIGDRLPEQLIPGWFTAEQWLACLETLQQGSETMPHEVQRRDRWFEIRVEPLIYQQARSVAGNRSTPETRELRFTNYFANYFANHELRITSYSPEGLLLILEDITNRKRIEENLNRQMQELQQLNRLKDDFLDAVSHELRAPMTNMKMAIHMLQQPISQAQRDRYLQILEGECGREARLIDDLLNLQRLEAGAAKLVPEVIQLQTWLPTVVEPFQERMRARHQRFRLQIPADCAAMTCDRSSLERILVELMTNACKYTPPEGEIVLAIQQTGDVTSDDSSEAQSLAPTGSYCKLIVSNTGSEIPAGELTRVFDKFYRVANSDRWNQGGTGLGLALIKKVVEQLNGSIELTSQAEVTTFVVQIPTTLRGADAEFFEDGSG